MAKKYIAISKWVGGGVYLIENPVENPVENPAKAIAFMAEEFGVFPKSQISRIVNNYFESKGKTAYLVPQWLVDKNRLEGLGI